VVKELGYAMKGSSVQTWRDSDSDDANVRFYCKKFRVFRNG